MRLALKVLFGVIVFLVLFIGFTNVIIVASTYHLIADSENEFETPETVLVLGTSRLNKSGERNQYFDHRLEAVEYLYTHKEIDQIILSGDNRTRYYNEPGDMQKALLDMGIPEEIIILDPAGLRTLDSVVRCKEVFGRKRVLIITQRFHLFRALYIGKNREMDVFGFEAEKPEYSSFPMEFREIFARTVAFLDIHILGTSPDGQ